MIELSLHFSEIFLCLHNTGAGKERKKEEKKRGRKGNFQQSQAGRGRELTKQNEKVGGKQDKMEPRSRGFMQAR